MKFEDFEYWLTVDRAVITVRVRADLIHLFWGDGVGPQYAVDIVEANRPALDVMARQKLADRRLFTPDGNCSVALSAADWED